MGVDDQHRPSCEGQHASVCPWSGKLLLPAAMATTVRDPRRLRPAIRLRALGSGRDRRVRGGLEDSLRRVRTAHPGLDIVAQLERRLATWSCGLPEAIRMSLPVTDHEECHGWDGERPLVRAGNNERTSYVAKHAKPTLTGSLSRSGARGAAAVAMAAVGLSATAPAALAGSHGPGDDHGDIDYRWSNDTVDAHQSNGVVNVADNTVAVPIRVCHNYVPVNVAGVQVPVHLTWLTIAGSG